VLGGINDGFQQRYWDELYMPLAYGIDLLLSTPSYLLWVNLDIKEYILSLQCYNKNTRAISFLKFAVSALSLPLSSSQIT
jgi:hypothetical protein